MHSYQRLAREVLANKSKYPHLVLQYATAIDEWFNTKRKLVKFVWDNKQILRDYRIAYNDAISHHITSLAKRRYAIFQLRKQHPLKQVKLFNEFLQSRQTSMNREFLILKGMLALIETTNHSLLYQCVLAVRKNDYSSIPPEEHDHYNKEFNKIRCLDVEFIGEILLWKLAKLDGTSTLA